MQNIIEQQLEQRKTKALELIHRLATFVNEGNALGIAPPKGLLDKLAEVQKGIENSKLLVALVGGFSEGKTSIAAAWLGRLDKSTMKISQTESSDQVSIYDFENLCIVDTPGLFGFKEKMDTSDGEAEKYKDITKRYISKAHIVLYVMNPDNPIKDSHTDDLRWMFGEEDGLNLLPRTIFVLSQFDKVADIEDEKDFQRKLDIKRSDVLKRLHDVLGKDMLDGCAIPIVAVVANPFDEGVEYWLAHMDEWHKFSHIEELRTETNNKIKCSGGPLALANEARSSVIREVIHNQLPLAQQVYEQVAKDVQRQIGIRDRQAQELAALEKEIPETKVALKGRIVTYFQDLCLQVERATPESFGEFFHHSIGDDGCVIEQRVDEMFLDAVGGVNNKLELVRTAISNEVAHRDSMMNNVMRRAMEGGSKWLQSFASSGAINNEAVIGARNALEGVLGPTFHDALKFKPWGAHKLAGKITSTLKGAGLALGVFSVVWDAKKSWDDMKQREEFHKKISSFAVDLKNWQNSITSFIDAPDFASTFFPMYQALKKALAALAAETEDMRQRGERFSKWCEEGEAIDVEFRELDSAGA